MDALAFPGYNTPEISDALARCHVDVADLAVSIAAAIEPTDWETNTHLLFHRHDGLISYLTWSARRSSKMTRTWGWFTMADQLAPAWQSLTGPVQAGLFARPRFHVLGDAAGLSDGLLAAAALMDTVSQRDLIGTLRDSSWPAATNRLQLKRVYEDAWRCYLDAMDMNLWVLRADVELRPGDTKPRETGTYTKVPLPTNTTTFYSY